MRTLGRLLVLLILMSTLAIGAATWFALAERPLVPGQQGFSAEDVARAERLIRGNDPRRLPPGTRGAILLSNDDLNLLGGYLINRATGAQSRVSLTDNAMTLQATRRLAPLPQRRYLNIEIGFVAKQQRLEVSTLRVGALRIPAPAVEQIGRRLLTALTIGDHLQRMIESIQAVELGPAGLRLAYTWHPDIIDDAAESLFGAVDQIAVRYYHDRLVALQHRGIGRHGDLASVMQPLFADARTRSVDRAPTVENAALISVLGAWATRGLTRLVPGDMERPSRFRLKLRGRRDFAKHFVISAALSARGDSALSNAVGLVKEIIDTDRGSGFSFSDIAADLAGSRFGEVAVDSATAQRLQAILAAGVTDQDLMPPASDLPDHMDSAEFEQRFARVGSPAYEAVMADIRRRIDGLPLYR